MSDVIWNENARNAVFAYDAWLDVNGEHKAHESVERFWESTDSIRPQPEQPRKTVGDAVAEHNNRWPFCRGVMRIGYSPKLEHYFAFGYKYDFCKGEYKVCTREEFEACVAAKAKSEPEWTHVHISGDECKIIAIEPDINGYVAVMWEGETYGCCKAQDLKPIKPTITKSEAWDMMADYCGALSLEEFFHELQTEYKITN